MIWLHRWSGLIFGWALYVIALTGTVVVFSDEISVWMQPELPANTVAVEQALITAQTHLQRAAPVAEFWSITPSAHHGGVTIAWAGADSAGNDRGDNALFDAVTGAVVAARDSHGTEPLVDLHFRLHSGPVGMWIVASAGMVMLLGLVTGVIVHRRIFRDFFMFRIGKGQRSWLDAHNIAGVLTLPFQFVIAFTGLMIFPVLLMPGALQAGYGGDRAAYVSDWYLPTQREASGMSAPLAPLLPMLAAAEHQLGGRIEQIAVAHPGDAAAIVTFWRGTDDRLSMMADWAAFDGPSGRMLASQTRYPPGIETSGVMVGLHFAKFGGAWTRWLYFFSGLASTALIATGLLLWTVKRGPESGKGLVAALNLATIAGLPMAIAAYFAANRLLPVDLTERGEWEIRILFLSWAACLGWALMHNRWASWAGMMLGAAFLLGIATILGGTGPVTLSLALSAVALGTTGLLLIRGARA
ncbi:PepSY-associated TM helix domain-containing protein [Croceibacterium xixiisoli]|nr:PepSY-associated TM helix domain-containing protein [Croceibacterium xixiisoli]